MMFGEAACSFASEQLDLSTPHYGSFMSIDKHVKTSSALPIQINLFDSNILQINMFSGHRLEF